MNSALSFAKPFLFNTRWLLLLVSFSFLIEPRLVFGQGDQHSSSTEAFQVSQVQAKKNLKRSKKTRKKRKKRKSRKKLKGQKAIVQVDGSALYKKADFDSQVLEYLAAGTKLVISRKPKRGKGNLGLFYRAKTPKGKLGYLVDVEVVPQFETSKYNRKKKVENPFFDQIQETQKNPERPPVYFTRYLGVGTNSLGFAEKIAGKTFSDQLMIYGFRLHGPGTLIDGPPLDFGVYFTPQVPKYYSDIATNTPSGYLVFGDLFFMLPFFETPNSALTYGVGLMWTYTSFQMEVNGRLFDNQEFRIGAAAGAGYTYRMGNWALRGDVKYYYEKTGYLGMGVSIMKHY